MKNVAVFCGSSHGADRRYADAARELGGVLAKQDIGLVYGGGNIGLMGVLADAVLEGGGHVLGVIPHALARRELAHQGIQDLRLVETMHERKAVMAENADAFVAMPGGMGTFDEFFEILTWAQLGFHRKPSGILNTAGYFDGLIQFLDHSVREGFVRQAHRSVIEIDDTPAGLLERLRRRVEGEPQATIESQAVS